MSYYAFIPTLQAGGVPVAGLRIFTLPVVVFCSAHLLLRASIQKYRPHALIMLLVVPQIAGLLASIVKADSHGAFVYAFSGLILTVLAFTARDALRRAFLVTIVFAVVASLLLSLLDARFVMVGRDFLPFLISGRAQGLVDHPNTLGILSGVLLGASVMRGGRRGRYGVAIAVIGLLAAASQTSILATTCGLGILAGTVVARRWGWVGAILVLVAFAVIGYLGVLWAGYDLLNLPSQGVEVDTSLTGRTTIWQALLDQNLGWFGLTTTQFTSLTESARGVNSAHDLWLEAWGRSGLLGLVATIVTYLSWVVLAIRRRDRGLGFVVVFLGVMSITEGVLFEMPIVVVFACFAVWCAGRTERTETLAHLDGRDKTGWHAAESQGPPWGRAASLRKHPASASFSRGAASSPHVTR